MRFSELPLEMLAELLHADIGVQEEVDEFTFSARCTRQQLINYLFDVSAKETNVKLKHVSGLHGYLLKSVCQDKSGAEAYRNIFQFDPVKGFMKLLFDDRKCLASIRTDKTGPVYICWNPILFLSWISPVILILLLICSLPLFPCWLNMSCQRYLPKDVI